MPRFHQFAGFQIDVRCRDHNPPHFHVIGPDFHALIRIGTLQILKGRIPSKVLAEAVRWAAIDENHVALVEEWRRLNERD